MDHHQPQPCNRRQQQQNESPGSLVVSCMTENNEKGIAVSITNSSSDRIGSRHDGNAAGIGSRLEESISAVAIPAARMEGSDNDSEESHAQGRPEHGKTNHPTTIPAPFRRRPRIRRIEKTKEWLSRQFGTRLGTDQESCCRYNYDRYDDDKNIDGSEIEDNRDSFSHHSNDANYAVASYRLKSRKMFVLFLLLLLLIGSFRFFVSSSCRILATHEDGNAYPPDRHGTVMANPFGRLGRAFLGAGIHLDRFSSFSFYPHQHDPRTAVEAAAAVVKETDSTSTEDSSAISTLRGGVATSPNPEFITTHTNDLHHEHQHKLNSTKHILRHYLESLMSSWPSLNSAESTPSKVNYEEEDTWSPWKRRKLVGSRDKPKSSSSTGSYSSKTPSKSRKDDPQLVIAGKMSVDDAACNIAQYNLRTKEWSLTERIQLSLYNSYSGGEVYSLLANHTNRIQSTSIRPTNSRGAKSERRNTNTDTNTNEKSIYDAEGSGELIVVGAFDTTYRNSQVTYCSVGKWNGDQLTKVGEGLCNSALSKGMKITTAAMAGPQDVYAAGSFQTQVWNGDRHEFVKIFNIAHYNAAGKEGPVWLPLDIGQITCSWCTVTVLALAWDSKRRQLHIAGKFNSIDGMNVPAGLAIYDLASGRLVPHPGGGLVMKNRTQDGVGTALQLDEEKGVLYVMGSFERLTASSTLCAGLAAYDINANRWTCLANPAHTVEPTGGGNMLLTPYGLMVAGKTSGAETTWENQSRPYTIALLNTTLKTHEVANATTSPATEGKHNNMPASKNTRKKSLNLPESSGSLTKKSNGITESSSRQESKKISYQEAYHEFEWSWLPGFNGNDEPLNAMANGLGDHEGAVFIAGDNFVAKWSLEEQKVAKKGDSVQSLIFSTYDGAGRATEWVATTEILSTNHVRGAIMAISQLQLMPFPVPEEHIPLHEIEENTNLNIKILITLAFGCLIGILGAVLFNRQLSSKLFPCFGFDFSRDEGIPLDTLSNSKISDAYRRAMKTRYVEQPHLLTIIDPQEIFLQRIIGEGTFGRVWSARWNSSSVAVKEFIFAQAAVIGKSSMQQQIVEEIIGEAGMMAILRHPNVLQLFGCSLTAQAIWIVSELCSLGSLRQVLDDRDRSLPDDVRISLALQVAEGMSYLHNQDPMIIHRDLKSHNIFVHETFVDTEQEGDSNIKGPSGDGESNKSIFYRKPQKMKSHSGLVAKIGDWGSARAALSGSRTMTHGVGTACWLAPEVIKHARSSRYSDVYGYGIILWELSSREEVYKGLESTQIIAKVANEGLRPPVPKHCPWSDVMTQCWAETPTERLNFNEVVVELKRISKELEEKNNRKNLLSNENRDQRRRLEDIAEETPLILVNQKIRRSDEEKKKGKKK